uniref:Uncharacterized protein n=1 Tax=Strongyloides venezuelensis TaxID=75913 RepID=A0A0K0F3W1_STRVS
MINKDYVKALVEEAVNRLQQTYEMENLKYKKSSQEYQKYINEKIEGHKANKILLQKKNMYLRKKYSKMNKDLFGNENFIESPEDYEFEMKNKKYQSFEDILSKNDKSKEVSDQPILEQHQKFMRSKRTVRKISKLKLKKVNCTCSRKKKLGKKSSIKEQSNVKITSVPDNSIPITITHKPSSQKACLPISKIPSSKVQNSNEQNIKLQSCNLNNSKLKKYIVESQTNTKIAKKNIEVVKKSPISNRKRSNSLLSKLSLKPIQKIDHKETSEPSNEKKSIPKKSEYTKKSCGKGNQIIKDNNLEQIKKKSEKDLPPTSLNHDKKNKDKSYLTEFTQKTVINKVISDKKEVTVKEGNNVCDDSKRTIQDKSGAYEMLDKFKIELLMDKGNSPII